MVTKPTKRESLMGILILLIFAAGLIAFFWLIPFESVTLSTFIGYMSSLSTIVMVLVYILTTSQQLNAMRSQLTEMQYSRNVQAQPLLSLEKAEASFELPRYYVGPKTEFKEMHLLCRIYFTTIASNIGNGPAVAIDFLPKLVSVQQEFSILPMEGKKATLVETFGERVECISLRGGDSKKIHFMFIDEENKTAEAMFGKNRVALELVLVFKNALGMTFKQKMAFWMDVPSQKENETLKLSLKSIRTAEIDFAEQVKEFGILKSQGRDKDAEKVFDDVKTKLKERFGGQEKIVLSTEVASGSFSIEPISQSEYKRLLAEKEEAVKRILGRLSA